MNIKRNDLIRINSIDDLAASFKNKPFGCCVRDSMDYIIEMTKNDLMKYKDFGGYALDIRSKDREGEYIALICHIDTVPANLENELKIFEIHLNKMALFSEEGHKMIRGPLVAVYYELKIIKELCIELDKLVRLLLVVMKNLDMV